MRTKTLAFAGALAMSLAAIPTTVLGGGNGIECINPATGEPHSSPGVCVKTMPFGVHGDPGGDVRGVGQAAKYLMQNYDYLPPEMQGALADAFSDGRITAGELVDLNCTTPNER